MKKVIFDFDGVLEFSGYHYKACAAKFPGLTPSEYSDWFEGNVHAKRKGRAVNEDVDFTAVRTRLLGQEELEPSIIKLIKDLSRDYELHIISSNSEVVIKTYLAKKRMDSYFKSILGSETDPSKIVKFGMILNDDISNAVFITDSLGDVVEANHLALKTIAVTWGVHSKELLKRTKPYKIVDTIDELSNAITYFFNE